MVYYVNENINRSIITLCDIDSIISYLITRQQISLQLVFFNFYKQILPMKIISTFIIWFGFRCINSLHGEEFNHFIIVEYNLSLFIKSFCSALNHVSINLRLEENLKAKRQIFNWSSQCVMVNIYLLPALWWKD